MDYSPKYGDEGGVGGWLFKLQGKLGTRRHRVRRPNHHNTHWILLYRNTATVIRVSCAEKDDVSGVEMAWKSFQFCVDWERQQQQSPKLGGVNMELLPCKWKYIYLLSGRRKVNCEFSWWWGAVGLNESLLLMPHESPLWHSVDRKKF